MEDLKFCKSSFSAGGNECVEIAVTSDGGRAVRDSKNPDGAVLEFTHGEWAAFIKGAVAGEFGTY